MLDVIVGPSGFGTWDVVGRVLRFGVGDTVNRVLSFPNQLLTVGRITERGEVYTLLCFFQFMRGDWFVHPTDEDHSAGVERVWLPETSRTWTSEGIKVLLRKVEETDENSETVYVH